MRRIVTAITAISLAFSLVAATATPANAAVAGYDSAYAGESAFLNLQQGQAGTFTVFFANTGATSWVKSTTTQVDLAACLEDKVTCNAQDASEATSNSGWLSTTRYATTTQTTVAPGQIGTFTYNVLVPAAQAAGTYRFNGALVLASSGADIRNEGYYQDVTVGGVAGAASITSLTPTTGTTSGGTDVVISGSGIVCNPTFPIVSFGGTNATVLSCGASSLTADSPAHAAGTVTVTVTNPGGAASNGLTYRYADTGSPVFTSMTVSGDLVHATFSEPVCRATAFAATDWTVNNISSGGTGIAVSGDNIPLDCDDAITTATLTLAAPVSNGAFVEATLNDAPDANPDAENVNIQDAAGNFVAAPQSRQATATAVETTAPTIVSASGNVGSRTITITFSEPVYCPSFVAAADVDVDDNDGTTTDPTVTGNATTNACDVDRADADTSFAIAIDQDLESDTTYTVTFNIDANSIEDSARNDLEDGSEVSFTSGAGDFTPPTMIDARVVSNVATTDFREMDDAFSLSFSEVMDDDVTNDSLQIQDQDGTVLTLTCTGGVNNVVCDWNAAGTTITITVNVATLTVPVLGAPGEGSTLGMQIPFNVTTLSGFSDAQGNVPNVLGSSDRLVDFE